MGYRLFKLLAAVSLLLYFTATVFWVESYRNPRWIRLDPRAFDSRLLVSENGQVEVVKYLWLRK